MNIEDIEDPDQMRILLAEMYEGLRVVKRSLLRMDIQHSDVNHMEYKFACQGVRSLLDRITFDE